MLGWIGGRRFQRKFLSLQRVAKRIKKVLDRAFSNVSELEFDCDCVANLFALLSVVPNLAPSRWFEPAVLLGLQLLEGTQERPVIKNVLLFFQHVVDAGGHEQYVCAIADKLLRHFHRWPRSSNSFTARLIELLIVRVEAPFKHFFEDPSGDLGTRLDAAQRELCFRCVCKLRGPRLRVFLQDLAGILRNTQSVDSLIAYEIVPAG